MIALFDVDGTLTVPRKVRAAAYIGARSSFITDLTQKVLLFVQLADQTTLDFLQELRQVLLAPQPHSGRNSGTASNPTSQDKSELLLYLRLSNFLLCST